MLTWLRSRLETPPLWRTALSAEASLDLAVADVTRQLKTVRPAQLAAVFISSSFASDLPRVLPLLKRGIEAEHWIGCCGSGVIGAEAGRPTQELEQQPGLSLTLLHLPGAVLQPFQLAMDQLPDLDGSPQPWQELIGMDPADCGGLLLLTDPGSRGVKDLVSGLDYAYPDSVKVGGIAANHAANHGSLLFGDGIGASAVGCAIGGDWGLEAVVSQGCRPIGPVFEVEASARNVMLKLQEGSDPQGASLAPVKCLQSVIEGLEPADRELVRHSLFIGIGRHNFSLSNAADDETFLVRNLMGVDPQSGAMAIADSIRIGQRVQFQLRDGRASREELQQLLLQQRQRCGNRPLGAFLFACLGRGEGLYGMANVDSGLGRSIFPGLPISGVFCNGEIGPIARSTALHGFTASWCFLVPRSATAPQSG